MGIGRFDSLLLLSFGGPERPEDVMPFLRNVTKGRGVPDERLAVVAKKAVLVPVLVLVLVTGGF